MATTNKSLTTYLPADSLDWLKGYCSGHKHLLNNDGNPKPGTAIADIISRLATGELTIPTKIEPTSAVLNNVLYGTEIEALKGEVEDLKKLFTEYRTSNAPSTVPDDSLRTEVEALGQSITDLKTYYSDQFAAVNELISLSSVAVPITGKTVISCEGVPTANQVGSQIQMVNTESIAVPAATSQEKPDADREYTFAQLAKQLGYKIPDGVKATSPRKEGAEGLIEFAATLGYFYHWDGKNRKFSKLKLLISSISELSP